MLISHHKHLVQDGPVIDEALEDTGRTDVGQTVCTEDQRHLQLTKTMQRTLKKKEKKEQRAERPLRGQRPKAENLTSWESEPCATLVLQTGGTKTKKHYIEQMGP